MSASFEMPDPGIPTIPLERLDLDSEQAARYVAESRPFVAHVDWPCVQWSPEVLKQRVGDKLVPVWQRDGQRGQVPIHRYLDFIVANHQEATTEYVIHNYPVMKIWGFDGPNADLIGLLDDARLPAFVKRDDIKEIYIWARNTGWYDNKSHCEPNAAAALNLQILGKKRVWLFPPEDAGLIGAASPREELMGPPFFSAGQTVYHPSQRAEFANARCYETTLEPGDVIHIPTFWFHWFVHYNLYQLNLNIWFGVDKMQVNPVSADWAYMNALCGALGGFETAKEKFAALPLETQELLTKISNRLIEDRACTDLKRWETLKLVAPKITLDPSNFKK